MNHRYDFIFLFDVKDGNPNGDPDANNHPRIDPETSEGLVTDVCLKRKIRNYVGLCKGEKPPFEIYVKEGSVLNATHIRAYEACEIEPILKKLPKKKEDAHRVTMWMCNNFYDIRTFGAVMTTDVNCGKVDGPLQLNFSKSIDSIFPSEHSITRCAVTNEKDVEKERTMGNKFTIPYALYRMHGYINPFRADKTGFDSNGEDLELLWTSLEQMFELDRSAARGEMSAQKIIIFQHDTKLGNARAEELFKRVKIKRTNDIPRSFEDYEVTIEKSNLPSQITLIERL